MLQGGDNFISFACGLDGGVTSIGAGGDHGFGADFVGFQRQDGGGMAVGKGEVNLAACHGEDGFA